MNTHHRYASQKVKFFSGEQVPLEMHKVRVVQKLNLVPVERRVEAITEAAPCDTVVIFEGCCFRCPGSGNRVRAGFRGGVGNYCAGSSSICGGCAGTKRKEHNACCEY